VSGSPEVAGAAAGPILWFMGRGALIAVLLLGVSPGCHRPGTHAAGSGYGVGIPRVNYQPGKIEPQLRGSDTLGVRAPSEAYIGRIRSSKGSDLPQAGRIF
jgi:hypothetical protein